MPVLYQVLLKVLADHWIYVLFITDIYCVFLSPLQLSVAIQIWVSQVALVVKNLPANSGDDKRWVWSLGLEDPLEEEMAAHSSILAWWIPWTGAAVPGLQGVRQDWSNLASRFSSLKKKKNLPLAVFHALSLHWPHAKDSRATSYKEPRSLKLQLNGESANICFGLYMGKIKGYIEQLALS